MSRLGLGRFLEVEIEEGGIWRVGLGFGLLWVLGCGRTGRDVD